MKVKKAVSGGVLVVTSNVTESVTDSVTLVATTSIPESAPALQLGITFQSFTLY